MKMRLPIAGCLLILSAALGCSRPLSSVEYLERGIMLAQREQFAEAMVNFDRAMESDANNAGIYYERAVVLARQGDPQRALDDYTRAIELAPDFIQAYDNRGRLLARLDQHTSAIEDFSRVIDAEPQFAAAFQARGISHHELNQIESALSDLGRAIELQPDAISHQLRGSMRSRQGRFTDAIADFDDAIELDGQMAAAWLGRAIATQRLGHTERAIADLQRAAKLDTGFVTDDILDTLHEMSQRTAKLPTDSQAAAEALIEFGWTVKPQESMVFPLLAVKQPEQSPRVVCVATMNARHSEIIVPGDWCTEILKEDRPKSLLLFVSGEGGGGSWRLIENWRPARAQMKSVSVRVAIAEETPAALAQAD